MAFISWLMSQGQGLEKIAPAMVALGDAGTFAQLYAMLMADDAGNAWPKFQSAIQALPNGVTNDDPFGALPASVNNIAKAAKALSAVARPPAAKAAMAMGVCQPKSKRLLPPNKTQKRPSKSA
jgi:hypothetical protein